MRLIVVLHVLLCFFEGDILYAQERDKADNSCLGKNYALIISVSDYSADTNYADLPNVEVGAKNLVLELEQKYNFDLTVLHNPSSNDIYEALKKFKDIAFDPYDQFFIFLSGHGEFNEFEKTGYFIPSEGEKIELPKLKRIIRGISCEHILITVDACHSGTLDDEIVFQGRVGDDENAVRNRKVCESLNRKSGYFLTSAMNEVSRSETGGSPFVRAITERLREPHKGNRNGLVFFEDLLSALAGVNPRPHYGKLKTQDHGGFVFVAKKNLDSTNFSTTTNVVTRNINYSSLAPSFATFTPSSSTVKPFRMAKTEVSVAEFAIFMKDQDNDYVPSSRSPIKPGSLVFGLKKGELMATFRDTITWRHDPFGNKLPGNSLNPVVHVSWLDAIAYCNWLSRKEDFRAAYKMFQNGRVHFDPTANGYRLPTVEEWEYVAKRKMGGKSLNELRKNGEIGDFVNATYDEGVLSSLVPINALAPNEDGIVNLYGNVREWCWNQHTDKKKCTAKSDSNKFRSLPHSADYCRATRGGSWGSSTRDDTLERAHGLNINATSGTVGFRLVRSNN